MVAPGFRRQHLPESARRQHRRGGRILRGLHQCALLPVRPDGHPGGAAPWHAGRFECHECRALPEYQSQRDLGHVYRQGRRGAAHRVQRHDHLRHRAGAGHRAECHGGPALLDDNLDGDGWRGAIHLRGQRGRLAGGHEFEWRRCAVGYADSGRHLQLHRARHGLAGRQWHARLYADGRRAHHRHRADDPAGDDSRRCLQPDDSRQRRNRHVYLCQNGRQPACRLDSGGERHPVRHAHGGRGLQLYRHRHRQQHRCRTILRRTRLFRHGGCRCARCRQCQRHGGLRQQRQPDHPEPERRRGNVRGRGVRRQQRHGDSQRHQHHLYADGGLWRAGQLYLHGIERHRHLDAGHRDDHGQRTDHHACAKHRACGHRGDGLQPERDGRERRRAIHLRDQRRCLAGRAQPEYRHRRAVGHADGWRRLQLYRAGHGQFDRQRPIFGRARLFDDGGGADDQYRANDPAGDDSRSRLQPGHHRCERHGVIYLCRHCRQRACGPDPGGERHPVRHAHGGRGLQLYRHRHRQQHRCRTILRRTRLFRHGGCRCARCRQCQRHGGLRQQRQPDHPEPERRRGNVRGRGVRRQQRHGDSQRHQHHLYADGGLWRAGQLYLHGIERHRHLDAGHRDDHGQRTDHHACAKHRACGHRGDGLQPERDGRERRRAIHLRDQRRCLAGRAQPEYRHRRAVGHADGWRRLQLYRARHGQLDWQRPVFRCARLFADGGGADDQYRAIDLAGADSGRGLQPGHHCHRRHGSI